MRTKIKAKFIIGNRDGQTVVFQDGELLYEGNTILEVGCQVQGSWDREVDLGLSVVSPGFIDLNALGDIDHELFYAEQTHGEKLWWSTAYLEAGPQEAMTAEEEAFKSLYAYSQLISHGITTAMPITCVYYKKAAETMEEIVAAAENAKRLGLRVYLGPSYLTSMHVYDPRTRHFGVKSLGEEGTKGIARAEAFARMARERADELVQPVMVPERLELQTEETLVETKRFAKAHHLPVRLHAAQGDFEYNRVQRAHGGMSSIQYLDSIGFLDEQTLIPHAIFASGYSGLADKSDRDLEILRDRGVSVIHCPLVYSRSGMALESFARYRRFGVRLCMGTDTFPPDPFANIRMGSALSMHVDRCKPDSYYRAFFEAFTLGGARALGREDLGRLAPGCKADFIAVDLGRFHMGTYDDPLRTICMCATGRDVTLSVINGKTVMQDGRIPGLDYEELQNRAQRYYNKLKDSFRARSCYSAQPADEFFQTSYPIEKQ